MQDNKDLEIQDLKELLTDTSKLLMGELTLLKKDIETRTKVGMGIDETLAKRWTKTVRLANGIDSQLGTDAVDSVLQPD